MGYMNEVFVIAPYNTNLRMEEYTYSVDPDYGGGRGDEYLDWIEQQLLPIV
jgi:hypothetical protein